MENVLQSEREGELKSERERKGEGGRVDPLIWWAAATVVD